MVIAVRAAEPYSLRPGFAGERQRHDASHHRNGSRRHQPGQGSAAPHDPSPARQDMQGSPAEELIYGLSRRQDSDDMA